MNNRNRYIGAAFIGAATLGSACIMCNSPSASGPTRHAQEVKVEGERINKNKEMLGEFIRWYSSNFITLMADVSSDMKYNLKKDGNIETTITRLNQQELMCLEFAAGRVAKKEGQLESVIDAQYENVISSSVVSGTLIDYRKVAQGGKEAYKDWSEGWIELFEKALVSEKPAKDYRELIRNSVSPKEFDEIVSKMRRGGSKFYTAVRAGVKPGMSFFTNKEIREMEVRDLGFYDAIRKEIYGEGQTESKK